MNDKQKAIFEDSLQEYSLKRAYIDVNNKVKVFSNWVLVDYNVVPVKPVSDSFEMINNKDLLNRLNLVSRPKILSVERNPQKDTFFYNGYFPNAPTYTDPKGNTLFTGFEVGNTFSDKFFPFVNYSLYHYTGGFFLRTGFPILYPFTRKTFNDSVLDPMGNLSLIKTIEDKQQVFGDQVAHTVLNLLPKKFEIFHPILLNATTRYELLLALAVMSKKWGETAYELMVKTNYKIWDYLWKQCQSQV